MGTARLRVTASAAVRQSSSDSWLPTLERRRLEQPDPLGAHAWETTDGRFLYGRRQEATYWLWSPGVATYSFTTRGRVFYDGADETAAQRLWSRSALPLALEARGVPVLHASALRADGGCVAICGRSTAGKSTVAAAAGSEGLDVVADDAVALRIDRESVAVLTLPFELRPRPAAPGALDLHAAPFGGAGGEELALRYVVLLEPDAEAHSTSLEEVAPTDAFGALMLHAYCFSLEDSKARLVDDYTRVVQASPTSRLRFRPEHASLRAMVSLLRALLA